MHEALHLDDFEGRPAGRAVFTSEGGPWRLGASCGRLEPTPPPAPESMGELENEFAVPPPPPSREGAPPPGCEAGETAVP